MFINLIYLFFVLIISGCKPAIERELSSAREFFELGQYSNSLSHYDKVVIRSQGNELGIIAAREAAKIALFDLKQHHKSIEYFKFLVLHSQDPQERVNAQKQIAEIYFEQLSDYSNAIIELNRLLNMLDDTAEKAKYKMNIARAYYYQNNFFQAQSEVEEFLRRDLPAKQKFDMSVLKGNILIAQKNLQQAVQLFNELINNYAELAKKENLELTLSIIYEELGDYNKAIQLLEKLKLYHPVPEYIDLRIKKLIERKKNMPGAKGLRK